MPETVDLKAAKEAIEDNRLDDALILLKDILNHHPDHLRASWLLLQCQDNCRDREGALEQLTRLLGNQQLGPSDVDQLGKWAYQRGYPLDAVLEAWNRLRQSRPNSADTLFNLAYYLGLDGQFQDAVDTYREAIRKRVRAPEEAELNIASIYMDKLQDYGKAKRHLEQARRLNPGNPAVYYNLGNLAERLGDREKAAHYFGKSLEMQPDNDPVLARLADTHRFKSEDDTLLKRMVVAALTSNSRDLHFSLGRAYDQLALYDKAWLHYSQANAMDAAVFPPYDSDRVAKSFESIKNSFDANWLKRFSGDSRAPVFLCGIYRSGSTLLEQMLGAHPAFTAGGESDFFPRLLTRHLPLYPEGLSDLTGDDINRWRALHEKFDHELTGGNSRLTDKRPDNFLCAGLIKAIIPDAKFVVTERDPRDNAISIFATRLGPRQNYSTRLENIRHYIGQQKQLVDYWESLMGEDLIRVRYEDLVAQPEPALKELLGRLGEEFDDRCLSFHEQGGAVKTASVWQVREPLHSRSIGRWKNYSTAVNEAFGD